MKLRKLSAPIRFGVIVVAGAVFFLVVGSFGILRALEPEPAPLPFGVQSADAEAEQALRGLEARLLTLPALAARFQVTKSVAEMDVSANTGLWAVVVHQEFSELFVRDGVRWRIERREIPGHTVWHPASTLQIGTGNSDYVLSFDGTSMRLTQLSDRFVMQAEGGPRPNHPVAHAGHVLGSESLFLGFPYYELRGAAFELDRSETVQGGVPTLVLRGVRSDPGAQIIMQLWYDPASRVALAFELEVWRSNRRDVKVTWQTELAVGDEAGFLIPLACDQHGVVYAEDGSVLNDTTHHYEIIDFVSGQLPDAAFENPIPGGGALRDLDTGEQYSIP